MISEKGSGAAELAEIMPGHRCIVCGNQRENEKNLSFRHFPSDLKRRASWLEAFGL